MTNAEIAVKIIDIKIAILKIMSKTNKIYLAQYNALKQGKDKEILKIGMRIQRNENISEFIDIMLLKSILNSPDFDISAKKLVLNLCPETLAFLQSNLDDTTKENLNMIQN